VAVEVLADRAGHLLQLGQFAADRQQVLVHAGRLDAQAVAAVERRGLGAIELAGGPLGHVERGEDGAF
jgi:hypothetical protein